MQTSNKANCPRCGKEGALRPKENEPDRVELYCECNPFGPVLEIDAPENAGEKERDE